MHIVFSVIVPVFQKLSILRLCVEALKKTIEFPTEIILINDCSPHDVYEYLESLNAIEEVNCSFHIIHNLMSLGSVKSINRGISIASGEIIVFMDSDVIMTGLWQKEMKDTLSIAGVGAVGGILTYPQTEGIQSCGITFSSNMGRHLFLNNKLQTICQHYPYGFKTNAIVFALCGFKKRLFCQIGTLDERFFNGYEDYDFGFRIKKMGLSLIINTKIRGMHFEKSNGIHRQINRKQNLGLFWNLHANEQICDLWDFMKKEADYAGMYSKHYIGLDLCQVRHDSNEAWKNISSWVAIDRVLDYSCFSEETGISLLEFLAPDFFLYPIPIIFLCDNFVQLLGNSYWYSLRAEFCSLDIICDLCGNVVPFKDLQFSFWPGTKIR